MNKTIRYGIKQVKREEREREIDLEERKRGQTKLAAAKLLNA
jgi:hypothetical protein